MPAYPSLSPKTDCAQRHRPTLAGHWRVRGLRPRLFPGRPGIRSQRAAAPRLAACAGTHLSKSSFGLKASVFRVLLLIIGASWLPLRGQVAEVLLNWKPTPGLLPPDLIFDAGSQISTLAYTSPGGTPRVGIRSELSAGLTRSEFEWRPPPQTRGTYEHATGGELWVGFRLWVTTPSNDRSTSYFQLGPVRDQAKQNDSNGYYQLQLTRESSAATPLLWRWREFMAMPTRGGVPLVGAQARIVNPGGGDGYVTLPKLNAQPAGPLRNTFSSNQEDTWVAHLKMRSDSTGVVRIWRNGEKVVDSQVDGRALPPLAERRNALADDFTRVKWGPYGAGERKVAIYADIRIAEGGADDGYRSVAPPDRIFAWTREARFTLAAPTPPNADPAKTRVTGLPWGWVYTRGTQRMEGTASDLVAGARILWEFFASDGSPLNRVVWEWEGDAGADSADLDNDGVANLMEDALETTTRLDRRSPWRQPDLSIARTPDQKRLQISFQRVRADLIYQVEASSTLGSTATWLPVATNPGQIGTRVTVSDTVDLSQAATSARFLRLRVSRP